MPCFPHVTNFHGLKLDLSLISTDSSQCCYADYELLEANYRLPHRTTPSFLVNNVM